MHTFLQQVASHYYQEYGKAISSLRFVFPSKRAALFFRRALGELAETPIFAPKAQTMPQLVTDLCPERRILDPMAQLFILYDTYKDLWEGSEMKSFDRFVYWGRVILKDFDTIDRYLVPAEQLYRNVRDYKELEDVLSMFSGDEERVEELIALIQSFWEAFDPRGEASEYSPQETREEFLAFWDSLGRLYTNYTERLQEQGLAYEGMLYRELSTRATDVADEVAQMLGKGNKYVFVGLFDLSPSELKLLDKLHQRGLAEFCWDEGIYPLHHNSTHTEDTPHILSRLIRRYQEQLGYIDGPWRHVNPEHMLPKQIQSIQCSSVVEQVQALPIVLKELGITADKSSMLECAIILSDETMLLPAISAIPSNYDTLNVSLGYPLDSAPIASMMRRWWALRESLFISSSEAAYPTTKLVDLLTSPVLTRIDSQLGELAKILKKSRRYATHISSIEAEYSYQNSPLAQLLIANRHDGLSLLNALIDILLMLKDRIIEIPNVSTDDEEKLFLSTTPSTGPTPSTDPEEELSRQQQLEIEFLFHYLTFAERLRSLILEYQTNIGIEQLISLLSELVSEFRIPFEGNPLEGIQMMGFLESRALHFPHVIYLATNEDKLPRRQNTLSLIPHSLRRGWGLPTGEMLEAGATYYFYQSVARSESLTLLYNNADAPTGRSGESPYIYQLKYLYQAAIQERRAKTTIPPLLSQSISHSKDATTWELLERYLRGEKQLSASALNDYIRCPLLFYYRYVLGIREDQEVGQLLAPSEFGDLFHLIAEELYQDYKGKYLDPEELRQLAVQKDRLRKIAIRIYGEKVLGRKYTEDKHLGTSGLLYTDMLTSYMQTLLYYDIEQSERLIREGDRGIFYIGSEAKFVAQHTFVNRDNTEQQVQFTGRIDRLDKRAGVLCIVDYKTGLDTPLLRSWESLDKAITQDATTLHHKDPKVVRQTLLYCLLVEQGREQDTQTLSPEDQLLPKQTLVYALRQMSRDRQEGSDYESRVMLATSPGSRKKIPMPTYGEIKGYFDQHLQHLLQTIFDPTKAFTQTTERSRCAQCPFAISCNR